MHHSTCAHYGKKTRVLCWLLELAKPSKQTPFPPTPVVCTRDTLSVPYPIPPPPLPSPALSLCMCINWYVTSTIWAMYFAIMCFSLNIVMLLHVPREICIMHITYSNRTSKAMYYNWFARCLDRAVSGLPKYQLGLSLQFLV